MKKGLILVGAVLMAAMIASCAGPKRYHERPLGDPSGYFTAHFPEMDSSGDGIVTWEEFKARFPDADADTFRALDQNKDGGIDHGEWHNFMAAHCPRHGHRCCTEGHHNCNEHHDKHQ